MTALRWLGRVGGFIAIASIALALLAATTGSMSETEMVDNSLYIVLAFGFGIGLTIGARSQRTASGSTAGRITGAVIMAAAVAGSAAFARWYFLVKIFDRF